jgi:hypothetical protein
LSVERLSRPAYCQGARVQQLEQVIGAGRGEDEAEIQAEYHKATQDAETEMQAREILSGR